MRINIPDFKLFERLNTLFENFLKRKILAVSRKLLSFT